MRRNLTILFGMVTVIGLLTPSAQAFQIKINGTTVFLATHEGHTVGNVVQATDPDIGTYNQLENGGTGAPLVATVYSSDAFYGSRSVNFNGEWRGQLGVNDLPTAAGDVLEVSGAMKVDDQFTGITFILSGPETKDAGSIFLVGSAGGPWGAPWDTTNTVLRQFGGGDVTDTIVTGINGDEWHEYVFTHTVGSTSITVNIDGNVQTLGDFKHSLNPNGIVDTVWMRDPYNASNQWHDAIPEPATLSLLVAGGLLLLSKRHRRA